MRLSPWRFVATACLLLVCACAGPAVTKEPDAPRRPAPAPEPGLIAARALVEAAPADWQPRWEQLHKMAKTATPAILRALRENPAGAGAQAAVHLLGESRDPASREYLLTRLRSKDALGAEAALALGKLADPGTVQALRNAVESAATPMTTRAAAAAALVRMGEGPSIVAFLRAVFLAASPYGRKTSRQFKIPASKSRWAHERYMIIEALRSQYEGETFGLDEDSSWPAMRDAANKMAERLGSK